MFRLIGFLKNNFFLQNLASWIFSKFPPFVEHNVAKYGALRKALYLTAIDQTEGDYLEFGVFTGSSFVFAMKYAKLVASIGGKATRFFGFDSFEGFGEVASHDSHPFYLNETFAVNFEKVQKNIKKRSKGAEFKLIKGYFDTTCRGKKPEDYGIKKSRAIFIDCDLMEPALDVFEFVRPTLQKGTMLLMDDYFSYRGDPALGLSGAFEKFQAKHPGIKWRHVTDYGMLSVVYVCYDIG